MAKRLSKTLTGINISTVITVPGGGTGVSSFPINSLVVGNDGLELQSIAPGIIGDVLTSNGTAWISSGITKDMIGLSNVDNTTDLLKPISTATQTALDLVAPIASPTFTGIVGGITKDMIGLSNVDNTTDLLKPISTATQTALDLVSQVTSSLPSQTSNSGKYLTTDGTTASWASLGSSTVVGSISILTRSAANISVVVSAGLLPILTSKAYGTICVLAIGGLPVYTHDLTTTQVGLT